MRRGPKPAKSKEGKPPVTRKSSKDDGRVRDLQKRLGEALKRETEALERETATSGILRIISNSPTDTQPVLDAVAESAARLCSAYDAVILRLDGGGLHCAAHYGPISALGIVIAATRNRVSGRAVVERQPVQVADAQAESKEFPEIRTLAREQGFRTILSVPLLRGDVAIGTIDLRRTEVQPFTDGQIALLQTFADQAVIAIENVRLFKELQTSNRDLTTALDQQTATSEVLRAITHAPTDTQPVFDTIVRNAVRLCNGFFGIVTRYDGHTINVVAKHNLSAEALELVRKAHARPGSMTAQALTSRAVVHVHDAMSAAELSAAVAKSAGYRTIISVPMLREGQPSGTINVSRRELQPFSDTEIDLLKT